MARPSKPLISRAAAVQASIAIIDSEGLESFSLPRLASDMGVRAPSLYHHFADKNEILTAIARHIAGKSVIRPRRPPGPDWPEYFVTLGLNFRQSVLRHRNAAPILIEHLPREVLIGSYEEQAPLTGKGCAEALEIDVDVCPWLPGDAPPPGARPGAYGRKASKVTGDEGLEL